MSKENVSFQPLETRKQLSVLPKDYVMRLPTRKTNSFLERLTKTWLANSLRMDWYLTRHGSGRYGAPAQVPGIDKHLRLTYLPHEMVISGEKKKVYVDTYLSSVSHESL